MLFSIFVVIYDSKSIFEKTCPNPRHRLERMREGYDAGSRRGKEGGRRVRAYGRQCPEPVPVPHEGTRGTGGSSHSGRGNKVHQCVQQI